MGSAQAQDNGGTQAGLTLSPGLVYDDEKTRARLGLGATYETTTRNQRLTFGFDGAFDSGYGDISDSLRTPRVNLSYALENRSTALETELSYRRAEINKLIFDDDLDSELLAVGTGQRSDLATSARLSFGRDAPFGGTFDVGYRQRSYLNTVDPSLLDEEIRSAGLSLQFTIDPRLVVGLSGQVSETDVDGLGTDQRRKSLSAGLDMAVSPSLDVSLTFGTSQIVNTGPLGSNTIEGTTASLSATRARPNGTIVGRISTDVTAGGRKTSIQVDRALDLPRGGTLSFGGGVGQINNSDLQTQVRLAWLGETPTAQYGVRLDRALAVDRDGDTAINSQISLSWQQDLNQVSTFGAALALRDTERLGSGTDNSVVNLSLTWQRELTQDWGVRSTYTHQWGQKTATSDTNEHTVFLGVERSFQWRP